MAKDPKRKAQPAGRRARNQRLPAQAAGRAPGPERPSPVDPERSSRVDEREGRASARKRKSGARRASESARKSTGARARTRAEHDSPQGGQEPGPRLVAVGASPSGWDSLERFLAALPPRAGFAYALVLSDHPEGAPRGAKRARRRDEAEDAALLERLKRACALPLELLADACRPRAERVYLAPFGTSLRVDGERLVVARSRRRDALRIDPFLRSLAQARLDGARAVVLAGSGSDGAQGVREIEAAGGWVLVESPERASPDEMPRAALAGEVDPIVRAAEELPAELVRGERTAREAPEDEARLEAVLALARERTGIDYGAYKRPTLQRRVHRRMALVRVERLEDYLARLRAEPAELERLTRDLLIGVTRFFRDGEPWVALAEQLDALLERRADAQEPLRVWVPGCSSGEEAYTLAILVAEAFERRGEALRLQLFGTDVREEAIARARAASYPANIAEDVSAARLRRWFRREGERYVVHESLREASVFARQDLLADAPFSNLDLVSCRNVLIYLDAAAQRRVLETFHFALREDGLLLTGSAEPGAGAPGLFETVSIAQRLHRRGRAEAGRPPDFPVTRRRGRSGGAARARPAPEAQGAASLPELARRAMLAAFAPASVLVDRKRRMLYLHGALRQYLDFPSGEASHDLLQLALPGLRARLRVALQAAMDTGEHVEMLAPRVQRGEASVAVRVSVHPLRAGEDAGESFLVSFRDAELEPDARLALFGREELEAAEGKALRALESELRTTREDLQSTVEELETANEELKASNEEILSTNEELRSANEELQASKEELQSLNEELTSVNAELGQSVEQLQGANDDLENFLSSSQIATLFLDRELRLRRATSASVHVLSSLEGLEGRELSALPFEIEDPALEEDARAALRQGRAHERELRGSEGRCFLRRALPYRSASERIEGVVLTFVDVTPLDDANRRLRVRVRQQALVAELGRLALRARRLDQLFEEAARRLAGELEVEIAKVLRLLPGGREFQLVAGVGWDEGLVGSALVGAGSESQAGFTLLSQSAVVVEDLLRERRFRGSELMVAHGVRSGMSVVIGPQSAPWGVLGIHSRRPRAFSADDVHVLEAVGGLLGIAVERVRGEEELRLREREMRVLFRQTTREPETIEEALSGCIDAVCEITGWPIGHAWLPSPGGHELVSAGTWRYDDEERSRTLRERSEGRGFAFGEGFPGSIWRSGRARWIRDVLEEPLFERAGDASDVGVRGAFGFPVRVGDEIVAVLEFFSYEELREDDRLMLVVRSLAEQVGRVFERSRASLALRESAERLELALESGGMGVWDWDVDGDVRTWSDGMYRLLGYQVGEVRPTLETTRARLHPEDFPKVQEALRRAREERAPFVQQYRVLLPSGALRWVESRGRFTFDERGRARRAYGVATDITERRRDEERLREADRRKDAFLATLGHELRNPLAAIASGVQLLRAGHDDKATVAELHAMMARQATHMTSLLNDLLDVSRISRGDIELRKRRVVLSEVVAQAIETLRPDLQERRHDLGFTIEPWDLALVADPLRLEQMVANLLGNACRYTPPQGTIRLDASVSDAWVRLAVTDTGVGLSSEQLESVFEPFYQVRKGSGGLGIGLNLVQKLASLHGGRVEVASPGLGQGSVFTLVLPQGEQAEESGSSGERAQTRGGSSEPPRGLRVLVVEDHEDSARALVRLLRSRGFEVRAAGAGRVALAEAERFDPQVVLLDLGLPDISGLDVARALRSHTRLRHARLIALTGFGDAESAMQIRDGGFDGHLLKPLDLDALLRILQAGR